MADRLRPLDGSSRPRLGAVDGPGHIVAVSSPPAASYAELGGELADNGTNQHSGGVGDTKPSNRDNDATYVVARLNRDRPVPATSLPVVEDSSCRVRVLALYTIAYNP